MKRLLLLLLLPLSVNAQEPVVDELAQCSVYFAQEFYLNQEYKKLSDQADSLRDSYLDLKTQLRIIDGAVKRAQRMQNEEDITNATTHKEFHEQRMKALEVEGELVLSTMREVEIASMRILLEFVDKDCGRYHMDLMGNVIHQACQNEDFESRFEPCEFFK